MNRCIVTYAAGAHEELLDISLPTYRAFAERHGYDLLVTRNEISESSRFLHYKTDLPPAWNKIPLLIDALERYDEVVWFDCDLVIVDDTEDFPPLQDGKLHALVRHFEDYSEVPNSGVWRLRRVVPDMELWSLDLLNQMLMLCVFTNHGWWEQAALMTLMGYCVPPEGSDFQETKCRCVYPTVWHHSCQFMRLCWNSHPNYRADKSRIVHCSYPNMVQRVEVMRALVKDPTFNYPRYDKEQSDVQPETG